MSANSMTPEAELEWEAEGEWRAEGEADPFLPFLIPLAAKALPAIGRALIPSVRRFLPSAGRAAGSAVASLLPRSPGSPPAARVSPSSGRRMALRLLTQLRGIILRGEAEANSAEAALFGPSSSEWESGEHPEGADAALTEVLAAEAAHTTSEAEAEALLGTALPITIRIISGRRALLPLTPALVRANSRLVRGVRRSGPAGPQLLRTVPAIQRRTVASLQALQRSGRPVGPAMVAPVMAAQAARVLGTPRICGPVLLRNAVVRQRSVAPGRRLSRRPGW